ncbi:hypothetical protein B0O80DRAFT_163618 [Mortierella sp. GBAus27b]|nr:hypothetical protein B0O80DRAFT_163618 [Mortierella sp. GBAus27b]
MTLGKRAIRGVWLVGDERTRAIISLGGGAKLQSVHSHPCSPRSVHLTASTMINASEQG